MHLDSISNGFGSQSMALLVLRKRKIIQADISQSADTGSEFDCEWSDGRRTDAKTFFEEVIVPFCDSIGIKSAFVRTRDKYGNDLPPLHEAMILEESGTPGFVPVFGSNGGRMAQLCTSKWKVRAMRQNARRLGAKTMRCAVGLHCDEAGRVSGKYIGKSKRDGFSTFQDDDCGWTSKFYPFIDLKMTRNDCRKMCDEEGLPYMVSSQCNVCPHKDRERWERDTPETIERVAALEAGYNGNFFLTDKRIPLKLAIPLMKKSDEQNDFGCQNDQCGF